MEEWDQDKLEAVVKQKHGTEKNRPTDIICKFFLDAVEKKQYGWCAAQSGRSCMRQGPLSHRPHAAAVQVLAVPQRQGVQVPARPAAWLRAEEPDEGASGFGPLLCAASCCMQEP
jgi:hypothetical protein